MKAYNLRGLQQSAKERNPRQSQAPARPSAPAITPAEYGAFQTAYDHFNRLLFEGSLPQVLVTLQRHANAKGYFHADHFTGRADSAGRAHELAMNPDTFDGRTDEEILSTLAHEMAHVWQQEHGKPGRGAYHNQQWAEKMLEIGLTPTDTGGPGGKMTGQKVTHFISAGGRYAAAYAELKRKGFQLNWQSAPQNKEAKAKAASKTKYTCPDCEQNAWGKPDAQLICGVCYDDGEGEIVLMLPM